MSIFNRLLSRRVKALDEAAERPASDPKADTEVPTRFQDSQLYPDPVPEGVELNNPAEIEAFYLALKEPAMPVAHGAPPARSQAQLATDSSANPAHPVK